MALLSIDKLSSDVTIGLWRIDETIDQFDILTVCPYLKETISFLGSMSRRLETLAVYSLLYVMTGDNTLIIGHTPQGKPLLPGYNISISHTHGYATVILSRYSDVAVDIEYINDRVNRIVSHFMRDDEQATTTNERLVNWCAKETTFKYYSEQDLTFADMRVRMSDIGVSGCVDVDNLKAGTTLKIYYIVNQNFVLTYAAGCL